MAIKIIPEPDVLLSQAEYDRFYRDYQRDCMFMVDPPSFETYVKQRKNSEGWQKTR